jgi:hypothetical protein
MSLRLFDTSVLIAHLKGVPEATKTVLDAVAQGDAVMSVLSKVEIEGGMRSAERRPVARLMGAFDLVPVGDAIAGRAAEHLRHFRRSHQGIDIVDYVIAATAESIGADLQTLNVKHFPMFPGLSAPF